MVLTKAQAKSLSILEVARSLGMEMKRSSHKEYYWTEHDSFKIDTNKNTWHWYSRGTYGDTINLVQEIRQVSYSDAMKFLETGQFPEAKPMEEIRQPFRYSLASYEQPFREARTYLKETRRLSDETINFFLEKGVLAQARRRDRDGFTEDVLVFKYLDKNQHIVGASLQGLVPQPDRYEGKSYLKQIMYQSEGIAGLNVSIGSPERLIVAEAPIDLMSYYELHKDELSNVRLIAMEGLKEGVISRYAMETLQERGVLRDSQRDYTKASDLIKTSQFLEKAAQTSTLFHDHKYDNLITLAVDNDKAGTDFLEALQEKNIPVIDARPPKGNGQDKMDWNEYLQTSKAAEKQMAEENSHKEFQAPFFSTEILDKYVEEVAQRYTEDIETAEYLFPDGRLVSSWDYGMRGDDHRAIRNYFDVMGRPELDILNDHPKDFWNLVHNGIGAVRLVPETQTALLLEGQALTTIQREILQSSSLKTEVYQEGQAITATYLKRVGVSTEEKEAELSDFRDKQKAPDRSQEPSSNAGDSHRNPDSLGDLSPGAASKPVVDEPQPDFPVIAHLNFTTKGERMSTIKPGYHVITNGELNRLNKFAPGLQATAQWYLKELSGSTISYLYQDSNGLGKLNVQFSDENFAHLTGISPKGVEMKQVVYDFAKGVGDYGNIQVSHAIKDKSMVLPLLPDILSSQSFVFNDLSEVEKFNKIDLSQAIKTDDEDLLLAIRDVDGIGMPASVMRMKTKLSEILQGREKVILAIYRNRDGKIDQLSINEEYVKDGGKRFEEILKNGEFERYQEETYKDEVAQIHSKIDSDGDGISDEEELKQGTNPYDFRSTPSSKPKEENSLGSEEMFLASGSLTVADLIKNKDIAGLNQHLKEGIKAYLNSDHYKEFLTKMSQFNQYSSRNLRLILAQKPDASYLAPYNTWRRFDRYVKRGEKALSVIIPVTYVKKDQQGQPILDKNGRPETGMTFRLKPTTFDVSQTEGKEMPKAAEVKEQLTDLDYANFYRALMSIAKTNDVSVRFEEMENSRQGYYSPLENQIVLRSNDMNKSQIIKTFIHETAHSELHHANNPQREQLTRSTAELQAESVAYVVASYYGIDTSEYSFNYLAGWSNDKETLADLEAQLDIVQQEAKSLMVRMDQELEQLGLSQQKQTKQQFEQKLQKFKDQTKQAVEEHKQDLKAEAQSKKEKGLSK
ncbi:PBECR4 domain-containing protein [Streptococcus anginosus]|uniref:PBECR4 domain-containing protein n=1 Tax=Streptococcus anginosus TaxID=1328 RepID=UPI0039C270B4